MVEHGGAATDSEELAETLDALRTARDFAEAIIDTTRQALVVLDHALRVRTVNRAFDQLLGTTRAAVEGRPLVELFDGAWNVPHVLALLRDAVADDVQLENVEVTADVPGLGQRTLCFNACRFHAEWKREPLLLLALDDVTGSRAAAARVERARQLDRTLVALAQGAAQPGEDVPAFLRRVTAATAAALDVAFVTVWWYGQGDCTLGECVERFERASGRHTTAAARPQAASSAHRRSVAAVRALAIADVRTDPRTADWGDGVFAPLGIVAVLDAPIRLHGEVMGLLCVDHVGATARDWTLDEQSFAAAVADLVALACEAAERAKTEAALRDREARYVLATSAGRVAVWDWDLRTGHYYIDPVLEALLGFAPGEIPPTVEQWAARVHPDDVGRLHEAVRAQVEGQTPHYEVEHRLLGRDGGVRWVLARATLSCDDTGWPTRMTGTMTDITARMDAEAALRASERRFRLLAENAQDVIFRYRVVPTLGMEYISPAATAVTGYAPEEFYADPLLYLRIIHHDGRPLLEAFRQGRLPPEVPALLRCVRKDGRTIWTEQRSTRYYDARGALVGFEGVGRDVTAQQAAGEAIRQLNAELGERVRARTTQLQAMLHEQEAFTHAIAHELASPLRALDGFSAALLDEVAPRLGADGRRLLRRVRAAAQRMARLIDGVLEIARVGQQPMEWQRVDLTVLGRQVAVDLQRDARRRMDDIVVADGLAAVGDAALLRRLLTELLANALHATQTVPGARITLTRAVTDGVRTFLVRDNGLGFDQQYRDQLFRPFRSLHNAGEFVGRGIGLAIARRIVERHGGRIWATGVVGDGATFWFTLSGSEALSADPADTVAVPGSSGGAPEPRR